MRSVSGRVWRPTGILSTTWGDHGGRRGRRGRARVRRGTGDRRHADADLWVGCGQGRACRARHARALRGLLDRRPCGRRRRGSTRYRTRAGAGPRRGTRCTTCAAWCWSAGPIRRTEYGVLKRKEADFVEGVAAAGRERELLVWSLGRLRTIAAAARQAYSGERGSRSSSARCCLRSGMCCRSGRAPWATANRWGWRRLPARTALAAALERAGLARWLDVYRADVEAFGRRLGRWESLGEFVTFVRHVNACFGASESYGGRGARPFTTGWRTVTCCSALRRAVSRNVGEPVVRGPRPPWARAVPAGQRWLRTGPGRRHAPRWATWSSVPPRRAPSRRVRC